MKNIILLFTLLLSYSICNSQVLKFRSFSSCIKSKTSYGWTKWSEPTENNILIVFNLDKERITIYSKETQVYDIYRTYKRETDSDGDYTYKYSCIDADGLRCSIRWVKLNSQEGRLQVYIDYSDTMWMYNVNLIE